MADTTSDPPSALNLLSSLLPQLEQAVIPSGGPISQRVVVCSFISRITSTLASPVATGSVGAIKAATQTVDNLFAGLLPGLEGDLFGLGLKTVASLIGVANELVGRCRHKIGAVGGGASSASLSQVGEFGLVGLVGKRECQAGKEEIGLGWERVGLKLWEGVYASQTDPVFTHGRDWLEENRTEERNASYRSVVKEALCDIALSTYFDPGAPVFVRLKVGDVLGEIMSKHADNKNHLRNLFTAARLSQLLSQSDDRGLCRSVVELAFRLSPSANIDFPDQIEWVKQLFPPTLFGTDATRLKDQFNRLNRLQFDKDTAELLNMIAIGHVGRATMFTTPAIRCFPTGTNQVTTFKPTGNDIASAGGAPDLLNWFVNRWSATAIVENEHEGETGTEWYATRLEIPFEIVDRIDLLKDHLKDELTCRFILSARPLQDHKPINTDDLEHPADTSSTGSWTVLFTCHDADGDNERVLRKALNNRAQLYSQLAVGQTLDTVALRKAPRASMTQPVLLPPPEVYNDVDTSLPGSNGPDRAETAEAVEAQQSQVSASQSRETKRRLSVVRGDLSQAGFAESSAPPTSTGPEGKDDDDEARGEGDDGPLGQKGETRNEEGSDFGGKDQGGGGVDVVMGSASQPIELDLGVDVRSEPGNKKDTGLVKSIADIAKVASGVVVQSHESDDEPATQDSAEKVEAEAPPSGSKPAAAVRPSSRRSTSVQSAKSTTPEPTRRSSRNAAQTSSTAKPTVATPAVVRPGPTKKAQPRRPKTPPPRRQTPARQPKAATKAPPSVVAQALKNTDPDELDEEAEHAEPAKPAAKQSGARDVDQAEQLGGDGAEAEAEVEDGTEQGAGTMPASSLPQPVAKVQPSKQYGKQRLVKSPVKRAPKASTPVTKAPAKAKPVSVALSATPAPRATNRRAASASARRKAAKAQRVDGNETEEGDEEDGGVEESVEFDDYELPHARHTKAKPRATRRAATPKPKAVAPKPAPKPRAKRAAKKPITASTGSKATPRTKGSGKTGPAKGKGGDGAKKKAGGRPRAQAPLSEGEEPEETDEEDNASDVSTDYDNPEVTKKDKRKQRAQRKRSTTIDSTSTIQAPVKAVAVPAKGKAKAQSKAAATVVAKPKRAARNANKAEPKSVSIAGKKRRAATPSDDGIEEPLPGERRVAVSMGAAADAALARPMHKEQDDDQHKSKKAKPIQTLSQLLQQPDLPPKEVPVVSQHQADAVDEQQDQAHDLASIDDDYGGDEYQPAVNLPMEVDDHAGAVEPAHMVNEVAAVTESVEQLGLTEKAGPVALDREMTADDLLRKTSDLSAEGLIIARSRESQPVAARTTGPRGSQLVAPLPDRTLSPGSLDAVRELVQPTQSDHGSVTASRKTTAEGTETRSQERPSSSKRGSQLTAPLPTPELVDEIEEVADDDDDDVQVVEDGDERLKEPRLEVGVERDDDVEMVEEDGEEDDPITSGTALPASLPLPTPAQRSAVDWAAPDELQAVRQPTGAGPSQLVAPAPVDENGLGPSPSKLSTIPEGSQSSISTVVEQPAAVLNSVQSTQESADVRLDGLKVERKTVGEPVTVNGEPVDEAVGDEMSEVDGDEGVIGADDSGYLEQATEVEHSSVERSTSPPLVARRSQVAIVPATSSNTIVRARSVEPVRSAARRSAPARSKPTSAPVAPVAARRAKAASPAVAVRPAPESLLAPAPTPLFKPVALIPVKPAKRPAAALDEPAPLEPYRPPQPNVNKQASVAELKSTAVPTARSAVTRREQGAFRQGAEAEVQMKATATAKAKGKGKGKGRASDKGVEFRERVSQIELPAGAQGGQEEEMAVETGAEMEELVEQFGLGLSMDAEERAEGEEVLNGLFAIYVHQQRLCRQAVGERFERTKTFLTEQVAVPLMTEIIDESSELIGGIEAVVGRWKVMAENVEELCGWNERQGQLMDVEVARAKARFGF